MRFYRTIWWSPFLTHGMMFAVGALLVPAFFLLVLNSRTLLLLCLSATGLLAPLVLARLHGICLWKPLAAQLLCAAMITFHWPLEPDGNAKMAYANHLCSWLMILFLGLSCLEAATLLKRLKFSL